MSALLSILKEQIAASGPMTVADYMELALTHPEHGYYIKKDPFGQKGDFTTAPEISQIFGEMVGAWAAALWRQSDGARTAIVELGPGRGTLMTDFLRATAHVSGFHDAICIVLIEVSPLLKRFQRATIGQAHPRVTWQSSLDELPDMPAIFIANEFFDALPIRQYVKTSDGLREKLVDVNPDTGELTFTLKELGIRLVKGGKYSGDEIVVESCHEGKAIAARLADHVKKYGGGGLIIDYGYSGGSRGNTLQAISSHGFHPVLKDPGDADITAHIDFDALKEVFKEKKVPVYGPIPQGKFIKKIGGEIRLERLLDGASEEQKRSLVSGFKRITEAEQMGDLFKAMSFYSDTTTIPAGFVDDSD